MQDKTDNLSKNAVIYTVGNFLNKAISVLSAPIFTRLLSTHDYGRVTIYTTWTGIFTIFICLELKGSLSNAYIEYGKKNYKSYVKTCISLAMLMTLIWAVVAATFRNCFEKVFDLDYALIMLALFHSFFNGIILFLSHYLSILRKAFPYVIVSFGQLILNILFSIILILYSGGPPAVARITGQFLASALIGGGVVIFFICNREKIINFEYLKFGLLLSIPLIFHALGGQILSSSDKIMLSRIADDSITGVYSFAVTVIAIINAVSVSFNTAWIPFFYEILKKQQIERLYTRTKSYLSCYTIIACGFILIMPEMVKLLADKAYWGCIPIVIPLAISEFFHFLYFFPVNYELYSKQTAWIAVATVITGIINIGLNFLWIPYWGAYGATLATLISQILCFIFHEVVARKVVGDFYIKFHVYYKYILGIFFVSIVSWIFSLTWFVRWMLAMGCGIILLKRIIKNKTLF